MCSLQQGTDEAIWLENRCKAWATIESLFCELALFVQVITIYVSVLHDKTALDACICSWCGLSHTFFTKQATTKTINHSKFWYKCIDMMRLIDQPSR